MNTPNNQTKQLRERLYSQLRQYRGAINKLADRTEYSREHISRMLRGELTCNMTFLQQAAEFLSQLKAEETAALNSVEAALRQPSPSTTQAAA